MRSESEPNGGETPRERVATKDLLAQADESLSSGHNYTIDDPLGLRGERLPPVDRGCGVPDGEHRAFGASRSIERGEDSETNKLIAAAICGGLVVRAADKFGYDVPEDQMHIYSWYRPSRNDGSFLDYPAIAVKMFGHKRTTGD